MSTGCSYCGVNPYVACRHRPAIERPQPLVDPPADVEKKTDLRPFSIPGRAFAVHRAKQRKEKAARRGK